MHNIKYIRDNFDEFKKKIQNRNVNFDLDKLRNLDVKNRELIHKKETLEKEKKDISKKKDKSLFEKSKIISQQIESITNEQKIAKDELNDILSNLPNVALENVPVGIDETFNEVVSTHGEIKKLDFKPKSHFELGENLKMLDFDLATKTTSSRFVFVKSELASLERAISNYMIDLHTKINGYVEVSPPLIAN